MTVKDLGTIEEVSKSGMKKTNKGFTVTLALAKVGDKIIDEDGVVKIAAKMTAATTKKAAAKKAAATKKVDEDIVDIIPETSKDGVELTFKNASDEESENENPKDDK